MINILFSILFVSFLGFGFVYGVDYSGIHRTFLLLNSTLVNEGVVTADDEIKTPYFHSEIFENRCLDFLGNNLNKYTSKFEVRFYYFDSNTLTYCEENCDSVRVSLKADILFDITYLNAFIYKVQVG